MDTRLQALQAWVREQLLSDQVQASAVSDLTVVSGDASFRRYFRSYVEFPDAESMTVIAVDAPPDKEDNPSFVSIAENFKAHGVNVPDIFAADFTQGFLLLSDFGDTLLLPLLNQRNVDQYYDRALSDLAILQQCVFTPQLPLYDEELLMREMRLFPDWLLTQHLQLTLSAAEEEVLTHCFHYLRDQALSQPQVTVHRDYHARNIMVIDGLELGYIDFQDAVFGPVTYDLVSLIRDCYVQWPQDKVRHWALSFKGKLQLLGKLADVSDEQFLHWLNTMGAQRHLKAAGIFARLYHRDGKSGYLADIPRTVSYLREEISAVPALQAFNALLEDKFIPAICSKDSQAKAFF